MIGPQNSIRPDLMPQWRLSAVPFQTMAWVLVLCVSQPTMQISAENAITPPHCTWSDMIERNRPFLYMAMMKIAAVV